MDYPTSEISSLELYTVDFSHVYDGYVTTSFTYLFIDAKKIHHLTSYEFLPNEFICAMDCVTLETQSTESGTKDFIVVGTTVNRGEDLAVRGAVSPYAASSGTFSYGIADIRL